MQNGTKSKGRRGRPPSYDREKAMKAIMETFWRQGFAATSLDDLATATGMNRPSLYAAFGNKKVMYLGALDRFRRDAAEAIGASAEQPAALAATMTAFFEAAIRFYCSGASTGCLVLCTATAEAPVDDEIRAALGLVIGEMEGQIGQLIACAVSAGETIPDAAALAKLLSAVLVSIAIQARAGFPESQLEDFARSAVTAALPLTKNG